MDMVFVGLMRFWDAEPGRFFSLLESCATEKAILLNYKN